jgi:hypothetical protein
MSHFKIEQEVYTGNGSEKECFNLESNPKK